MEKKLMPKHNSQLSRCHITMRITILSCKTEKYCARSRNSEEPWRSHSACDLRRLNCTTQKNCITLLYNTSLWCTSFNAQSVSTHAKHNSTASTKKRKSHPQPSIPLRAQIKQDSIAKRRRPEPSRARDNFSPQRNLRFPQQKQCFVQIPTFKSHPWCSSCHVICPEWLAKDNQNRKTGLENKYPSTSLGAAVPLRSAQTELAQHKRIATHYCRTHRFDAPVPMHKVSQDMQNTIAQHQQRREKVTCNPQIHCVRKSSKIPRQSGDARNRRARASQLFSATEPPFSRKKAMFRANPTSNIQFASMM